MATAKQKTAARKNVKKAAKAKGTLKKLSTKKKKALGKEGAKAAKKKAKRKTKSL